jgi:hypothetical protein
VLRVRLATIQRHPILPLLHDLQPFFRSPATDLIDTNREEL